MLSICLCLHIHLPVMLRSGYSFFDIGINHLYEDKEKTRDYCIRQSRNCLIPAGLQLLKLINKHKGSFKISISITGTAVEQLSACDPEAVEILKKLAETGCVEFTAETYYHTYAFLYSPDEFKYQVEKHTNMIKEVFNYSPSTFRNTSLVYNNAAAEHIISFGFKNILADLPEIVKYKNLKNSACFSSKEGALKILVNEEDWTKKIESRISKGGILNFFTDDLSAFSISVKAVDKLIENKDIIFISPVEAAAAADCLSTIDINNNDDDYYADNSMQKAAANLIYRIEADVKKEDNPGLTDMWRKLQDAHHFRAMSYDSSTMRTDSFSTYYDAFIVYANIVNDFKETLGR